MRWLLVLMGCAEGLHPVVVPDGGSADLAPQVDLAQVDSAPAATCPVSIGSSMAGEFNSWTPGLPQTLSLAPGLYAYKLVIGGNWQLDPDQPLRKWVAGVENSALRVADCNLPSLRVVQKSAGHYLVAMDPGVSGATLATARVTVRHGNA